MPEDQQPQESLQQQLLLLLQQLPQLLPQQQLLPLVQQQLPLLPQPQLPQPQNRMIRMMIQ